MRNTTRKDHIDYLKAFAIILVVIGHSMVYPETMNRDNLYEILVLLICAVHVPLFFFVAGYLCKRQDIKKYYSKKIFRIIIPFVLFTVLKLVYTIFISDEFAHASSLGEQIFDAFIYGSLYWFIYAIFIMYCLAPLFWEKDNDKIVRKRNIIILAALICINTILVICKIDTTKLQVFQVGKCFQYIAYFIAGIVYRQNPTLAHMLKKHKKTTIVISFSTVFVISYILLNYELGLSYLLRLILAFALMYILYIITKAMPSNIKMLQMLGKYSLQIMFFDSFFKVILFLVVSKFCAINLFVTILIAAVNIALGCICCWIIERIPYVRKLFGL